MNSLYSERAASESLAHYLSRIRSPSINPIRNLSHKDYLALMRKTHTSLIGCIRSIELQSSAMIKLVSDILDERYSSQPSTSGNEQEATTSWTALNEAWVESLRTDLSDIVLGATELANLRLAKVVASRAEIHASLGLFDFVLFFEESWQFVLECEVICKKMIVGLRGVIVGQVS